MSHNCKTALSDWDPRSLKHVNCGGYFTFKSKNLILVANISNKFLVKQSILPHFMLLYSKSVMDFFLLHSNNKKEVLNRSIQNVLMEA